MSKQTTRFHILTEDEFAVLRTARAAKRGSYGRIKTVYYGQIFVRLTLILTASPTKQARVKNVADSRGVDLNSYGPTNFGGRRKKCRWYQGGSVCYCCGVIQTTDFKPRWDEVLCKRCEKLSPLHLLLHAAKGLWEEET